MTYVIDFGGISLCRTESLIKSEIPYTPAPPGSAMVVARLDRQLKINPQAGREVILPTLEPRGIGVIIGILQK